MKILFLAPDYLDLHIPIIKELEKEGHTVHYIKDKMFTFDWHYPYLGYHDRLFKYLKASINHSFQKYWTDIIKKDSEITKYYDIFLCINGCSFHKILLNCIRQINPNIKTRLYLWDNSKFYEYFHNAKYFDKVYTYDLEDSKKFGAKFLPFYWISSNKEKVKEVYDISIVGTNHDNRYEIVKTIEQQIKNNNITYYFKILDKSLPQSDIIIHKAIDVQECNNIIKKSKCILDTDRKSQTGTTPRLIWALAMNKKIITTNQYIKYMPFYDPDNILIIDRNNPRIDLNFLRHKQSSIIHPEIEKHRFDLWIKELFK